MTKTTASIATKINNGVNVDALLGPARRSRGARGRPVQVARKLRVGDRNAQPLRDRQLLRPRRRAVPRQDVQQSRRTTRRSSRPRTTRRRRWRSFCPGSQAVSRPALPPSPSAAASSFTRSRPRSRATWTSRASSAWMTTFATASAASASTSTFDADASPDDIKSLVAQSQKRSAVFDIVTNPTNVFVTVN